VASVDRLIAVRQQPGGIRWSKDPAEFEYREKEAQASQPV